MTSVVTNPAMDVISSNAISQESSSNNTAKNHSDDSEMWNDLLSSLFLSVPQQLNRLSETPGKIDKLALDKEISHSHRSLMELDQKIESIMRDFTRTSLDGTSEEAGLSTGLGIQVENSVSSEIPVSIEPRPKFMELTAPREGISRRNSRSSFSSSVLGGGTNSRPTSCRKMGSQEILIGVIPTPSISPSSSSSVSLHSSIPSSPVSAHRANSGQSWNNFHPVPITNFHAYSGSSWTLTSSTTGMTRHSNNATNMNNWTPPPPPPPSATSNRSPSIASTPMSRTSLSSFNTTRHYPHSLRSESSYSSAAFMSPLEEYSSEVHVVEEHPDELREVHSEGQMIPQKIGHSMVRDPQIREDEDDEEGEDEYDELASLGFDEYHLTLCSEQLTNVKRNLSRNSHSLRKKAMLSEGWNRSELSTASRLAAHDLRDDTFGLKEILQMDPAEINDVVPAIKNFSHGSTEYAQVKQSQKLKHHVSQYGYVPSSPSIASAIPRRFSVGPDSRRERIIKEGTEANVTLGRLSEEPSNQAAAVSTKTQSALYTDSVAAASGSSLLPAKQRSRNSGSIKQKMRGRLSSIASTSSSVDEGDKWSLKGFFGSKTSK